MIPGAPPDRLRSEATRHGKPSSEERDRVADGHELQRGPGGERPGTVSAELSPVSPAPLEQHQIRLTVVPVVNADVGVSSAVLHAYRRPDPLAAGQLRRGDLDLGILTARECPGGPDVTGEPASPGDGMRSDRQSSVADSGPMRTSPPAARLKSSVACEVAEASCGVAEFFCWSTGIRTRRPMTISSNTGKRTLTAEALVGALVIPSLTPRYSGAPPIVPSAASSTASSSYAGASTSARSFP